MIDERVLLFIPAYNCEKQIPRVIAQITPEVRALLSEVIVVNNRATDATEAEARGAIERLAGMPAKILRNDGNYGLGGSHKVAFNYARAHSFDYCIVLHGDDQGSIADLAPHLRAGAHRSVDCLLGARFMEGSKLTGYSTLRTLGNRVFNRIYALAAGRPVHDLGSGLNCYAVRKFDDDFYLRCADDLTFNYHMLLRSFAAGWRLRFFPLEWREHDQISNVRLFRQAFSIVSIVLSFVLTRRRYLASDYSSAPGRAYSSTIVFDTTVRDPARS